MAHEVRTAREVREVHLDRAVVRVLHLHRVVVVVVELNGNKSMVSLRIFKKLFEECFLIARILTCYH